MSTAKKILFVLEEGVRDELESLIPPGQRSRVINEALKKELLFLRRKRSAVELVKLSSRTRPVSTRAIVEELKNDRKRR
ncbi:MAG: hypothetical protein HY884_03510 [Deltaproteobacteria bacterium]|nr:hypothetical protein [Deltaproteobacteria bacterium]